MIKKYYILEKYWTLVQISEPNILAHLLSLEKCTEQEKILTDPVVLTHFHKMYKWF